MDYRVQQRVSEVLNHASNVKNLQGVDRRAAQMLFSCFADLELIAVKAAERGDAIEGQLEDEYVHYYAFLTVAEVLGGKLPTTKSIQALLDFLSSLRGDMSLVLINLTAESWLEVFLHSLSKAGICDGLFAEIEKDEARHAAEAFKLKIPSVNISEPLMKQLEALFIDITRDPHFVLPIIHFAGQNLSARAAINVVKAHKKACKHLGIEPSQEMSEVEESCKETLSISNPTIVDTNDWEKARLKLWNDQAGICLIRFNVPWNIKGPNSLVIFEAVLTQALSYGLSECQYLNRTIANGKLYQCRAPIVGLRRVDALGRVFTIYNAHSHKKEVGELYTEFRQSVAKFKRQPYCTITEWSEFEGLQPAPRASAIITNVGVYDGIPDGYAPIVPVEGNSFLLTTNNITHVPTKRRFLPWPKWQRVVPVSMQIDHRSMDGPHSAELVCKILEWFKAVSQVTI